MLQRGAALTDFLLALTTFACASKLRRLPAPRQPWVDAMALGLGCEGVGCVAGGQSWALGVNLVRQEDLTLGQWAIVLTTALGREEIKSSIRLQCARNRTVRTSFFGRASRTRRERSIRPKISHIDFDLAERENFKSLVGTSRTGG